MFFNKYQHKLQKKKNGGAFSDTLIKGNGHIYMTINIYHTKSFLIDIPKETFKQIMIKMKLGQIFWIVIINCVLTSGVQTKGTQSGLGVVVVVVVDVDEEEEEEELLLLEVAGIVVVVVVIVAAAAGVVVDVVASVIVAAAAAVVVSGVVSLGATAIVEGTVWGAAACSVVDASGTGPGAGAGVSPVGTSPGEVVAGAAAEAAGWATVGKLATGTLAVWA
jgi:hypothetical protein